MKVIENDPWKDRKELLKLIRDRCYQEGDFVLKSGKRSDYYLDLRKITCHSEGASIIGWYIWRHLSKTVDAIGGPACGAIPIVASVVSYYSFVEQEMEGFWYRPDTKGHGTEKYIEGYSDLRGKQVALVEDVVTTGGSLIGLINVLHEMDCEVTKVVAVVDRLQGASQALRGYGFHSIFTINEVRGDCQ